MKTVRARKLPKEVQQHSRNQAVRLFQPGKAHQEIAEIVGLQNAVVCRWIRAWQEGGRGSKGFYVKKIQNI
jgi:transposase-like protein